MLEKKEKKGNRRAKINFSYHESDKRYLVLSTTRRESISRQFQWQRVTNKSMHAALINIQKYGSFFFFLFFKLRSASSVLPMTRVYSITPALFTMISTPRFHSFVFSRKENALSRSCSLLTLQRLTHKLPGSISCSHSLVRVDNLSDRTSSASTLTLFPRRASTIARPMPDAAPVTIADFPAHRSMILSPHVAPVPLHIERNTRWIIASASSILRQSNSQKFPRQNVGIG